MPIYVVCPKCSAKLNAPDTVAGKKVKCPKAGCGAVISVPTSGPAPFEVLEKVPKSQPAEKKPAKAAFEDDAPPKKKPQKSRDDDNADEQPKSKLKKSRLDEETEEEEIPKSKRRREEDTEEEEFPRSKRRRDDDDDDDDDDRPRKKKKKQSGGIPPLAIVGIVVGVLVVMGGVGYGIYAVAFSDKDSNTTSNSGGSGGTGGMTNPSGEGGTNTGSKGSKAAVPEGWVKFESAEVRAYFPQRPTEQKIPNQPFQKLYLCESPSIKTACLVTVIKPAAKPNRNMDLAPQLMNVNFSSSGFKELSHKNATLAGFPALEYVCEVPSQSNPPPKKNPSKPNPSEGPAAKNVGRGVYRITITDDVILLTAILCETGMPKAEHVDGFFDNIEILK